MPFITAGDPDLDFTAAMLRELSHRGCSLCELGIPYSDPIADGPVIQASYTRALAKKIKLADILEMTRRLAPALKTPVVTMLSYAIVYRHGAEQYVADAKAAGIAGAIVPDLPVEEAGPSGQHLPGGRLQSDSTGHADHAARAGLADRRNARPVSLLRLGHGHHRRTRRTAAGTVGECRLAAAANAAADLHRLWHQRRGAGATLGAGRRRADRRLGGRAAHRGGGKQARAKRCWPMWEISSANCWRRSSHKFTSIRRPRMPLIAPLPS